MGCEVCDGCVARVGCEVWDGLGCDGSGVYAVGALLGWGEVVTEGGTIPGEKFKWLASGFFTLRGEVGSALSFMCSGFTRYFFSGLPTS